MDIPLVSAEDVKIGRGRTKGEKYGKYAQSIAPHLKWLIDEIRKSPEGSDGKRKIAMKYGDLKKEMGREFEKKSDKAVYYGLKFVLFHEGIWVEQGKKKDDNIPLLVMRESTEKDVLPDSLARGIEPPEEDMPEPGSES